MKKTSIPVSLIVGAGLVLVSMIWLLVFQIRIHVGDQRCERILLEMESLLPEKTVGIPREHPDSQMPVLEIEHVDYVAMLEIPAFGVQLPVANEWNQQKLFQGPARYWGSVYDNSLVIGGMDDVNQFGFCDKIAHDTVITVTDMTGTMFNYTVCIVNRTQQADAQWLMDEEYDLTLFCYDMYSMEYIAVRCELNSKK